MVLKAYRDPYLGTDSQIAKYVKLKKDYIPGLGNSVNLLIISGRSDPIVVQSLKLLPRSWTTFSLACRGTGNGPYGSEVSVRFPILGQVSPPSISIANLRILNMHGRLSQVSFSRDHGKIRLVTKLKSQLLPSHLFQQPAITEVVSVGFDRLPNTQYLTLRFPRIIKIHNNRSVLDIISFAEYQH